jgi:hypothetical protein
MDVAPAHLSTSKPNKRAKLEGPKAKLSNNSQPGAVYSIFTKPTPRPLEVPLLPSLHVEDHISIASSVPSSSCTSPILRVGTAQPHAGSSREEAILVDSSPVRHIKAPRLGTTKARNHPKQEPNPPFLAFPSDSHVQGPQTSFSVQHSLLSRPGRVQSALVMNGSGLAAIHFPEMVEPDPTPLQVVTHSDHIAALEGLLKESNGHPAVQRLLDHARDAGNTPTQAHGDHLSWTEKWRPTVADQVLGNEDTSRYLRDWLAVLQLGGASFSSSVGPTTNPVDGKRQRKTGGSSSKPSAKRVVDRTIRRKRARVDSEDEEDNWIAPDSEDPYDFQTDGLEDEMLLVPTRQLADGQTPHITIASTTERFSFDDYLANTILLTGPSGSGKTAAVFACAAELGYEVFEVYPGIGRRGGAELERLIGDVGKNHLVNATEASNKPADKLKSRGPPAISSILDSLVITSSHNAAASSSVQGPSSHPFVGQSIVLIEEADILFKDDINFWTTTKSIIKDCHRPVIITCNGESTVLLLAYSHAIHQIPLLCR